MIIDGMSWLHEPPWWQRDNGVLKVRSGDKTDFWQSTYYGFQRDNGHFLSRSWQGEFTASLTFSGRYEALYDQAGMMVRIDATHWMKCGVEYTDGAAHLSVVATNGASDWSAQRLDRFDGAMAIRVSRLGDALFVQFCADQDAWRMARLAFFPQQPEEVAVGPMFCSPERGGFEAEFSSFEIGPPVSRDIH